MKAQRTAIIAFLLGGAAGALAGQALPGGLRRRGRAPSGDGWTEVDYRGIADGRDHRDGRAAEQRRALIEACIGIADHARDGDPALWRRVTDALAKVGVTTVVPDGAPFDPGIHNALHDEPTDDPARHLTVAATDKPGYADGGDWLRRPVVVVYRHGADTDSGADAD
ncbi:nucleotide exchange factor GrpE [Actinomadura chibensis]|uniref:Nucleotide exchange factor GrpE n=1 Tax=Actinomadura chibensis TaxID=392828 RepID=A0A5D0NN58_9ACTN|nr:nucleotide exchange factor GrpE [Actinomadura chibensis]TYB45708.1 nucleotide exchange factor GrpE [Actinomadura chibensis]